MVLLVSSLLVDILHFYLGLYSQPVFQSLALGQGSYSHAPFPPPAQEYVGM